MTQIITTSIFPSPFGELVLGSFENRICLCDWRFRKMRSSIDIRIAQKLQAEYVEGTSGVIEQAKSELSEYFDGERTEFSIPILPVGSDFQKTVWRELTHIPFGKTTTYLDLSIKLGNVKAIRAVATANGANALSILIPCHRVIGSDGGLVGYAGGIVAKRKLLELEGAKAQLSLPL
ncbi:MAG: methylated-DNA--[protein]-cysteine S-methyltransferase [Cryomorphaceae bacterium]